MRRVGARLALLLPLLLVLGLAGGGWYYSDQLLVREPVDTAYDVDILAVDDSTITLDRNSADEDYERADLVTDGTFGFATPDGYVHLTDIVDQTDTTVTRSYLPLGEPVTGSGRGQIQAYAYPDDPASLGLEVSEIDVPGPLGDYPAWHFPADSDDWVVFVHGRGATRAEALRAVGQVVDLGYHALVVSYRNDLIGPSPAGGHGAFGDAEWEDLQAAVDWLVDTHDVEDLVLWGYSQGGAVVLNYLRRGVVPGSHVATVLDSPLVSMQATLQVQAEERGIPSFVIGPLLASAKTITELRTDIEFDNLEHLDAVDDFERPMLVFHGRDDRTVPFGPSAELAAARPDLVTFVPHVGRHVRGWNVANETYTAAIADFLGAWR